MAMNLPFYSTKATLTANTVLHEFVKKSAHDGEDQARFNALKTAIEIDFGRLR